jgi:hypothetical protein
VPLGRSLLLHRGLRIRQPGIDLLNSQSQLAVFRRQRGDWPELAIFTQQVRTLLLVGSKRRRYLRPLSE